MIRGIAIAMILLAAAASAQAPAGGRVLDQIAAVVNGTPILASEVRQAAEFARFSAGDAPSAAPTAAELQTALGHLVDETLLDKTRTDEGYGEASDAAVERQWQAIGKRAGGAGALESRLRAFGLDASTVRALLRRQLTIFAFLNQHFSGALIVNEAEIQKYYLDEFVPAAHRRGATPAPLDQVRSAIAAILRQQELERQEAQWIAQLHAAAIIVIKPDAAGAGQ